MVRLLTRQASHTYGVLDPLVVERRDTKFTAASLSAALNVVMLPQGGYVDRGGSTRMTVLRRRLLAVALDVSMLSAPNGGTVAQLTDDDEATLFTTAAIAADPFVVLAIDLGAASPFNAIDLTGFKASAGVRDDCVSVQYKDGVSWIDIGAPFHLRLEGRSRRFALPPETGNLSAQEFRVVVTGGAGPGAISLAGIGLWKETSQLSETVVRAFNYTKGVSYQLALSKYNLDIFRDGVWQAAIAAPWLESQLAGIKRETSYDTVLFFHQGFKTRKLLRQGSDREWQMEAAPYENQPRADYGATYTNGVNEVQRVSLYGDNLAGNYFQLILEGNKSDEILIDNTDATTAASIKAKLEVLPGVDPGLTCSSPSSRKFLVEFSGGDNAGKNWQEMTALIQALDRFVGVTTVTQGKPAGEDIMSDLRGWPAAGRYAQERLLLGGITGRPNTLMASMTGEPFNYDTEPEGAAASLSYDITGEENTIREFLVGKTVLIFTDGSVYHLASQKLSAEEAPELFHSDAPGIDANLPALSLANAIYYIQRGGQALVKLNFDELQQNFIGENASVLSAFLMDRPKDWTLRRATTGNDADLIFYINQDGTLVSLTLMQSQEVSGFAPHATQGEFLSLATDGDQTVWMVCRRNVAATERIVLERMDPEDQLDSAFSFNLGSPGNTITGLEGYEGQTLHVWADGKPQGQYLVASGQIVLPRNVTSGRCGYWTAPFATDTPFQPEEEAQRPGARNKRVFGVDISVVDTTALAVAANGGAAQPVVINAPKTGTIEMEGFPGFTRNAQVTITQTVPGRLKVRSVKKRIAA